MDRTDSTFLERLGLSPDAGQMACSARAALAKMANLPLQSVHAEQMMQVIYRQIDKNRIDGWDDQRFVDFICENTSDELEPVIISFLTAHHPDNPITVGEWVLRFVSWVRERQKENRPVQREERNTSE